MSNHLTQDFRISVAPMMDWTTRHCRYFMRLISPGAVLYTEMITTGALLYGDTTRFLRFDELEHPVVVQLGGSDRDDLVKAAKLCEQAGFDEINLNVGCPSPRVQRGSFGACLMNEAQLVADCLQAMREACNIPVTVKTRLGVDDNDSYQFLYDFVQTLYQQGTRHIILHARKAWLKGLSPKENREVPPLDYERVYQIKQDFADCMIEINGGFKTIDDIMSQQTYVDGVMIGRQAYHDPYILALLEQAQQPNKPIPNRWQILNAYQDYVALQLQEGVYLSHLVRPILGLFCGQPGARVWRRYLSEHAYRQGAGLEVIQQAITTIKAYYD